MLIYKCAILIFVLSIDVAVSAKCCSKIFVSDEDGTNAGHFLGLYTLQEKSDETQNLVYVNNNSVQYDPDGMMFKIEFGNSDEIGGTRWMITRDGKMKMFSDGEMIESQSCPDKKEWHKISEANMTMEESTTEDPASTPSTNETTSTDETTTSPIDTTTTLPIDTTTTSNNTTTSASNKTTPATNKTTSSTNKTTSSTSKTTSSTIKTTSSANKTTSTTNETKFNETTTSSTGKPTTTTTTTKQSTSSKEASTTTSTVKATSTTKRSEQDYDEGENETTILVPTTITDAPETDKIKTVKVNIKVKCLADVLLKCCRKISFLRSNPDAAPPNVNHLLGLYQFNSSLKFNSLNVYKQVEARHNLFQGQFLEKFKPVELYLYQVYGRNGPKWLISSEIGSMNESLVIANSSLISSGMVCPPEQNWLVKQVLREQTDVCPPEEIHNYTSNRKDEGPQNHWNCTPGASVVQLNEKETFLEAEGLIVRCLDEFEKNVCSTCTNPFSECKFSIIANEFICVCKDGYTGDGKTCAKKLGPLHCHTCEGLGCSSLDSWTSQIINCPPGIYACQLFITGYGEQSDLSFYRMCAPDNLTEVHCIGMRNDKIFQDVPDTKSNFSQILQERVFLDVPFICGPRKNCTGNYTLSTERWTISCDNGSVEILCNSSKTTYTKKDLDFDPNMTLVKCSGNSVMRFFVNENEYNGLKGLVISEKKLQPVGNETLKKPIEIVIPGFTRYYRQRKSIVKNPYFMECTEQRLKLSPSDPAIEGTLCTCNSDKCNNFTKNQFNFNFKLKNGSNQDVEFHQFLMLLLISFPLMFL